MEWHYKAARRALNGVLAAALTTAMSPAAAYELETHSRLTLAAFEKSVLADATSGPLLALGVDDLTRRFRTVPPTGGGEVVPVAEVVGLAAQYEDQTMSDGRFIRHFFDPQQGGTGLGSYPSSRQWILESEGDIAEQRYSLRDAHQFYLYALTRLDKTSRDKNLVLLLQSIGRAVHHLQDMSQPAHTRDDIHPLGLDGDDYEGYTESQFLPENNRDLPGALPCGEPTIDLHQFNTAAKFWSDDDERASGGRGIAQFTSHNFVSQDTNFRTTIFGGSTIPDPEHPRPAFPASPVVTPVPISQLGLFGPPNSPMEFIGLPIADKVSGGGCFNNRAVVRLLMSGIFSQFPDYSLNSLTWEANYSILFPRAIAYSTGLMNYYFRGKLRLESYSAAGATVQVVVRNVSAADFALAEAPGVSGAEFSVYYDAEDGERHRLALQHDDLDGETIAYSETATFSFALPADVSQTQERPFVLVFDGNIGTERGIAAVAMGPPQDGALVVTPNYVPTDEIAGARLLAQSQGAWQATQQVNPVAGNIDWRGHRPEDVLTWHGPQGRYFGQPVSSSPNIYQGGKQLTVAPGAVIGTAITSQGDLKYLLAAVGGWNSVTIYRRPFQLSYKKDGLYDPLNNPLGWKAIQMLNASASSPMFFNASGTEAQMFEGSMHRIKVSVSGETATMARIENAGSYRRVTKTSSTPYVNVDVDPGPEQSCRANGYNCTGGSGICTSRDGNTHFNSCMAMRSDENVTHGSNSSGVWTQETIRSTVVCADYQGDVEVLCTIEAVPVSGSGEFSYEGQQRSTTIHTIEPGTCDNNSSGAQSFRRHYESDEESPAPMQFRVGSRTITLFGSSWNAQKNFNINLNWNLPSQMPPLTVDYIYNHVTRRYDSQLIYVDARYDILAYEEHTEDTVLTGSGTADVLMSPTNGRYYILLDVIRTEPRTSKTIVLADQQYVVATHVDEPPPQSARPSEIPPLAAPSGTPCSNGNPTNEQYENTFNYDADEFFAYSIHPKIQAYEVQQSLSALSQGTFVASLPIWIRQSDNSYVRQGTWNHLSNGDLSTLLPATAMPQDPTYTPTGIAR